MLGDHGGSGRPLCGWWENVRVSERARRSEVGAQQRDSRREAARDVGAGGALDEAGTKSAIDSVCLNNVRASLARLAKSLERGDDRDAFLSFIEFPPGAPLRRGGVLRK